MDIEKLAQENLVNGDTLDLENLKIGDEGAKVLAGLELLSQVSRLELGNNEISDEGLAPLMSSPHINNLKILNLKSNRITAQGALLIAQCPHLSTLQQLILKFNNHLVEIITCTIPNVNDFEITFLKPAVFNISVKSIFSSNSSTDEGRYSYASFSPEIIPPTNGRIFLK